MAIQGFRDRRSERLFDGEFVPAFQRFERQAHHRLTLLDEATSLADLTDYS